VKDAGFDQLNAKRGPRGFFFFPHLSARCDAVLETCRCCFDTKHSQSRVVKRIPNPAKSKSDRGNDFCLLQKSDAATASLLHEHTRSATFGTQFSLGLSSLR
jgi:hypothetical protein